MFVTCQISMCCLVFGLCVKVCLFFFVIRCSFCTEFSLLAIIVASALFLALLRISGAPDLSQNVTTGSSLPNCACWGSNYRPRIFSVAMAQLQNEDVGDKTASEDDDDHLVSTWFFTTQWAGHAGANQWARDARARFQGADRVFAFRTSLPTWTKKEVSPIMRPLNSFYNKELILTKTTTVRSRADLLGSHRFSNNEFLPTSAVYF